MIHHRVRAVRRRGTEFDVQLEQLLADCASDAFRPIADWPSTLVEDVSKHYEKHVTQEPRDPAEDAVGRQVPSVPLPVSEAQRAAAITHAIFLQSLMVAEPTEPLGASVAPLPPVVAAPRDAVVELPAVPADAVADSNRSVANDAIETDWDAMATSAVNSGAWRVAVDKHGRQYFVNRLEKITVWNLAKELRRRASA